MSAYIGSQKSLNAVRNFYTCILCIYMKYFGILYIMKYDCVMITSSLKQIWKCIYKLQNIYCKNMCLIKT